MIKRKATHLVFISMGRTVLVMGVYYAASILVHAAVLLSCRPEVRPVIKALLHLEYFIFHERCRTRFPSVENKERFKSSDRLFQSSDTRTK